MGEVTATVSVGVLLAPPPEELGGWLADAAAFDSAGADAIWVDLPSGTGLDPLAVTAALASLTFRSLLVAALPRSPGGWRADTLATIARLSHGRLALCGEPSAFADLTEGDEGRPDLALFRRLDDGVFERASAGGTPERWMRTASPEGRAAWRVALAEAAERGVGGLLVPAGPRLLDILRNPDARGDRSDLQLAQG